MTPKRSHENKVDVSDLSELSSEQIQSRMENEEDDDIYENIMNIVRNDNLSQRKIDNIKGRKKTISLPVRTRSIKDKSFNSYQ